MTRRSLLPRNSAPKKIEYQVAHRRLDALRAWLGSGPVQDRAATQQRAAAAAHGEFRFLNETRVIEQPDWSRRYGSPLWSFHFQYGSYIEDLAWSHEWTREERYLSALTALIRSWIQQHKPPNSDAYAPYVVGQRLIHWTRAFLLVRKGLDDEAARLWLDSLASQTEYLSRHVEHHLEGNHVISNLAGVITGSVLFSDDHFTRRLRKATDEFTRELDKQVLSDGMHYERSPHYHAQVMNDVATVMAVAQAAGIDLASLHATYARMQAALGHMSRRDGRLHLFNDAVQRDHPPVSTRDNLGQVGVWSLRDAGYFGYRSPITEFIIDCGQLGPRRQPAHAHCDLLSFELDLHGVPVVVDSGTSGYDLDPLREYVRSTRAHNTVQIGELDQHEMWATFRVARRGQPRAAEIRSTPDGAVFDGAYSPYFSRKTIHHRTIEIADRAFTVRDTVHDAGQRTVRSYIHLHPQIEITISDAKAMLRFAGHAAHIDFLNLSALIIRRGEVDPPQGWYAERFGEAVAAPVLECTVVDTSKPFGYRISLIK